ncbi:hypothetical protein MTR_1g050965 [Medicago truncatula]|uniref:Uncharacterized protein n=1 Tax=Medicago truncatula TaxID=3880 RepID=A0A072VHF9_MEDTR|nr:hypothetical protein MTR_1g050965 [Medicago truncatula]
MKSKIRRSQYMYIGGCLIEIGLTPNLMFQIKLCQSYNYLLTVVLKCFSDGDVECFSDGDVECFSDGGYEMTVVLTQRRRPCN